MVRKLGAPTKFQGAHKKVILKSKQDRFPPDHLTPVVWELLQPSLCTVTYDILTHSLEAVEQELATKEDAISVF